MTDIRIEDGSATLVADLPRQGLRAFAATLGGWLGGVRRRWIEQNTFRRELAYVSSLPDRELTDMGFTRHDLIESRRRGRWVRSIDSDEGW